MPPLAFFKGKFVPLSEAKMSIMTHAFLYGTACFEGIRGEWNERKQELYLFRVEDHYKRLFQSCKILNINLPFELEELCRLTVELVRRSGYKEGVYIRPLAYKSSEAIGVRLHNLEDDFLIFVIPFPPYLDLERGVRCMISSWRRVEANMIPPQAKITGLYVNSALAKTEAFMKGFDEAIMLTKDGYVSEGSGENIFIVVNGKLITPPPYDDILVGITRDTIIKLAREELGLEVEERRISRAELYMADECFLTGTAAYVTPVVEIDHHKIGTGRRGEITHKLQKLYLEVLRGEREKYLDWCTPVYSGRI